MAHDRQFHTATALADGRVLIAGGLRETAGTYVFAELFDPQTETFTPLAPDTTGITQQRQLHAAHLCSDHGVLILGGEAVGDTVEPLASVLRFDPATHRFTSQAPLATPRTSQPASPVRPSMPTPVSGTPGRKPVNPFLSNDPNLKARRLARALVSDMIAYLPDKREQGLKEGTLKALFKEEIKKSWEEYTEQVGREVAESTGYFREALNEILAGGRQVF